MNFLIGKEEDFFDFLNKITSEDKVAIISHTDLDGIASAIFMSEILKFKRIKLKLIKFIDYGLGMFSKILPELKKKKTPKVIFLDINEGADSGDFEKFRDNFDIFLIDHHPSEIKNKKNIIKAKTEDCAGFILYNLGSKLTNFEKWKPLICATIISDYSHKSEENFNFIKEIYPDITRENIFDSVPGKLASVISFGLIYFKGKPQKIFKLILKNKIEKLGKYSEIIQKEIDSLIDKFKKEAEYFPDKNLYFYYFTPQFGITASAATILSTQEKDKTFILVSDIIDEPEFVKVSSRNQNGNVNLNLLMKKGINGLENATGGGHISASAAKLMRKDIQKFKENILSD